MGAPSFLKKKCMIFGNLNDDLKKKMVIIFFFFNSLKMNETWANAPSLEHKFRSFLKNLNWSIFENNDASDDFWKLVS